MNENELSLWDLDYRSWNTPLTHSKTKLQCQGPCVESPDFNCKGGFISHTAVSWNSSVWFCSPTDNGNV